MDLSLWNTYLELIYQVAVTPVQYFRDKVPLNQEVRDMTS